MKATRLDSVQPTRSAAPQSKEFWRGTLESQPVILALTGIGPVNAHDTTEAAFTLYGGCIKGVVFSGVAGAGGGSRIGDVTVPFRWTRDDGKTWSAADAGMLGTATRLAPALERTNPLGDPACACIDALSATKTITFPYQPRVLIGGDGSTTDPFGGHAAPCLQHAGDLAGCEPCPAALRTSPDPLRFVSGVEGIVNPAFFMGLISPGPASHHTYVASDEETAPVAAVAAEHGVPWIGFRAISDGTPDPLMLPGFPAQFFVYKQIAADNAAAMTFAFVAAWG